jgi:hypothetical protein
MVEQGVKRIQRKRMRGWKMPENTVYVGRPSKWGNLFRLGVDGNREECVDKYEKMLREHTLVNNEYWLEPLKGKNLACWCPLDKPCHADILIKLLTDLEIKV